MLKKVTAITVLAEIHAQAVPIEKRGKALDSSYNEISDSNHWIFDLYYSPYQ